MSQPLIKLSDYARFGKAALSGQSVTPVVAKAQPQRQTITLPAPPSSNRYWRNVKGRMVKSAEARAYRKSSGLKDVEAISVPETGPVGVIVRWSRKSRRGDLDNRLKVVLDSLCAVAWLDDKQIVELHAYRVDGGDDTVTVTWWAA